MDNIERLIDSRMLPAVRQPGQYIGMETNARRKDPHAAAVRFVFAFPDAYRVGICHLGHRSLYHAVNDLDFAAADRAYCPLIDAEQVMRAEHIPLFGWESRRPVAQFDVVGFSLSYELCATNVLTMLDLAGIPLKAADRRDTHPLILGGDALADAPEPLAAFFDLFIPGDGERAVVELAEIIREAKTSGIGREDLLETIAKNHPSAYVPRFYEPSGPWPAPPRPMRPDIPPLIHRGRIDDLSLIPPLLSSRPLVPAIAGIHDRLSIEIMRGCPNGCRFCQAGWLRRPVRYRRQEDIVAAVHQAVDATGYDEISLLSLSSGDYPGLDTLIDRLNADLAGRHISISLPSLRTDAQLALLPKLTSEVRKTGLTIAAEAGSGRMRHAIGKNISEQDMIEGVAAAWEAGYRSVKVYFIAALPGETEQDIASIVDLCRRLSDTRRDFDGNRGAITASVSWFVPKPHTPMQWDGMQEEDYLWQTRRTLKDLARGTPIHLKFHRIEQSLLECFICRSGREAAETILAAWKAGARMDSWIEHWNWETWVRAAEETGTDFRTIIHSSRRPASPLPWSHITGPATEEILRRQRKLMEDALRDPTLS